MTRNRPVPKVSAEDAAFVRELVIFEDDKVIVFDKPSGLAVQGGGGIDRSLDELLAAFARSNGKRPRLVHRLDRGTSGVVVTARTQPAAAFLSEEFAARRTEKVYLALVRGALPPEDSGTLNTLLVKVEEGGRPRMIAAKSGRKGAQAATTHWRILARNGDAALVEARPETGRMHQIRAHLSIAGMPILGDWLYGMGAESAPRLMLHARRLAIRHPDGNVMHFEAPVPKDFAALVSGLGLQSGL
ncbi:RluA family pseudouridine synthase [Hyphomonas sp.]|uniref:RluA family pseudouridine synthase n=1 Tax=Hyphomonas sp. TaxID=87 RepID=UPI0032420F96